ncbi:hypothetical protein Tco_1058566 [Tanacetum coccineum]|uniref:Uncharacterized protein n=1 Tax=Tanacetum coccineum TaxID=301880 RepID=A0ABQ5H9W5_9ASTR
MASLASVFKDPGNEEKDGLVSLDTAMVPFATKVGCGGVFRAPAMVPFQLITILNSSLLPKTPNRLITFADPQILSITSFPSE